MWGPGGQEKYYAEVIKPQEIEKDQIEAYCQCGYLLLKPNSDFEHHNGGLAIKRSKVRILNKGKLVKKLTCVRYHSCNACVNGWK